jgi:hypothetical protein
LRVAVDDDHLGTSASRKAARQAVSTAHVDGRILGADRKTFQQFARRAVVPTTLLGVDHPHGDLLRPISSGRIWTGGGARRASERILHANVLPEQVRSCRNHFGIESAEV